MGQFFLKNWISAEGTEADDLNENLFVPDALKKAKKNAMVSILESINDICYDISKDATPESNKTRMEAINGLVSAYKVLKKL